jgi:hypothetical protein
MPALRWSLALLVLPLACGKTGQHGDSVNAAATAGRGVGGATAADDTSRSPAVQAGEGGAIATETSAGGDGSAGVAFSDPRIPTMARKACAAYPTFLERYVAESAASAAGAPSNPMPSQGVATVGPCNSCIGSCERQQPPACGPNEDCVMRHCTDPHVNICECVAACTGPMEGACLSAWVDYAVCVSGACAGICPGS